jgi:hypothetical protein
LVEGGVAAEERLQIALEAEGKLVERDLAPELRGGDENQQILLPALTGGGEGRLTEAVDEKLKRSWQGTAGLADIVKAVELLVARDAP